MIERNLMSPLSTTAFSSSEQSGLVARCETNSSTLTPLKPFLENLTCSMCSVLFEEWRRPWAELSLECTIKTYYSATFLPRRGSYCHWSLWCIGERLRNWRWWLSKRCPSSIMTSISQRSRSFSSSSSSIGAGLWILKRRMFFAAASPGYVE